MRAITTITLPVLNEDELQELSNEENFNHLLSKVSLAETDASNAVTTFMNGIFGRYTDMANRIYFRPKTPDGKKRPVDGVEFPLGLKTKLQKVFLNFYGGKPDLWHNRFRNYFHSERKEGREVKFLAAYSKEEEHRRFFQDQIPLLLPGYSVKYPPGYCVQRDCYQPGLFSTVAERRFESPPRDWMAASSFAVRRNGQRKSKMEEGSLATGLEDDVLLEIC